MKLTDKAKTEFEKWYSVSIGFKGEVIYLEELYVLPDSMKYGVYVDFFDSVGVRIEVFLNWSESGFLSIVNGRHANIQVLIENTHTPLKTRPEARTKAIELANEIFNKKTAS